jgi:uncharacterized phage protein (TIGR02216 family)
MAMGLGQLGLAPGVFWAMTPKELEAAVRGRFGQVAVEAPLSRNDLGALLRQYPDKS